MFLYDQSGIKVNQCDLWLDARCRVPFSFISHGHSDHLKKHDRVLPTPATLEFYSKFCKKATAISLCYNQPLELGDQRITLYPAGHILGSAMVLIESHDLRLLYSGDFKLQPSCTAEPIEIPRADVLIMESTYGHPIYQFPADREQTIARIFDFINSCFSNGKNPVLLAYNLGKAQEIMKIVGDRGYAVRVHSKAFEFAKVYEKFGIVFQNCDVWSGQPPALGEVLVLPPHLSHTRTLHTIARKRTLLLSGWAKGMKVHYRHDCAVPFSDHADYNDLIDFIRRVQPKKIYTTHGFTEFPRHLRSLGYNAELLHSNQQLSLF